MRTLGLDFALDYITNCRYCSTSSMVKIIIIQLLYFQICNLKGQVFNSVVRKIWCVTIHTYVLCMLRHLDTSIWNRTIKIFFKINYGILCHSDRQFELLYPSHRWTINWVFRATISTAWELMSIYHQRTWIRYQQYTTCFVSKKSSRNRFFNL